MPRNSRIRSDATASSRSESGTELARLLDDGPLAIVSLGPDLRIEQFTAAAAVLLNLKPGDAGRALGDVALGMKIPRLPALASDVVRSGTPAECDAQHPTGRWYSVRLHPRRARGNRVEGAVMILVDMDHQKQVELALRAREERERMVAQQAPLGVREADIEGRFLRVNDSYCAITGYSRDELLARRLQDISHPDDAARNLEMNRRVQLGEIPPYVMEKRYIRKDGGVVWIELHGYAARDVHGRTQFGVAIVQDITERKRTDDLRRENEERFRTLADTAPVLIWIAGPEGVRFVNRAWLRFLNVAERDVLAFGWSAFVHPHDRPRHLAVTRDAFARRVPFEAQARLRRADGQYRWMKFVALPRFGGTGEFVDFVGSAFDVTDLKQAEEVLREADRSKNRFLALLSHELRTPLAPLRDVVHLLRDQDKDPDKLQWTWGMIDRQVQTIARMIDDLLDVSRITQGKILLKREVVEIRDVVQCAIETVRTLLAVRDQELRLEGPTTPLYVHGDSLRLQQVVGNLLNNSSKFTHDRGHVSVTIAAVDEPAGEGTRRMVEIRVRDDGLGIEPDVLPHIFEPFFQADRTIERTQGGLGIGLALVRSLVEQHEGTVQAFSEGTGKGCQVVVRLPAQSGQPATTAPPASTAPTVTTQTSARQDPVLHRILVVDDHIDAGETMTMLLRAAGHDVRLVHRGPDALEEAGRFRPNVVLLDIGLPGMDGFEVARRLRQQFDQEAVLLVAISGYGQDEHRREAREAGFDHFFTKPVSIKVLREFLANPTSRGD